MRKLVYGLLGLATLGLGALSAQPASAYDFYRGHGPYAAPVAEFHAGPITVRHVRHHRPRRHYRPYRHYRPHRPARVVRRCWVEPRRIWNGYRWVRRPVEVCRTVRRPYYRY